MHEQPNIRIQDRTLQPLNHQGSSVSEVGILLYQQPAWQAFEREGEGNQPATQATIPTGCTTLLYWELKERERLEKGCVHFTVVGVQEIYQGNTVLYIMTEMLVRCWKREKRRERIAKLAGRCSFSFSRGEKSRTSSGTRVARCKLQRALYSLPARRGFFTAWILAFHLKNIMPTVCYACSLGGTLGGGALRDDTKSGFVTD